MSSPRSGRAAAAGCPHVRGAVVTEAPAAVTVQIFATITRCTEGAGGFVVAPVDLPSPLGTRTLRHGPVMPAGAVIGTAPPARNSDQTGESQKEHWCSAANVASLMSRLWPPARSE
jgi:hypothetical protein